MTINKDGTYDEWGYDEGKSYKPTNKQIYDIEKCCCINCRCGKLKCYICGSGEVPLEHKLCKIHDYCCISLDGCLISSIVETKNGRHYYGPLDYRDGLAKCEMCRKHPNFDDA